MVLMHVDIGTQMDIAKKGLAMQTISAMDEFQNIIGENKGWDSEEDMIKDIILETSIFLRAKRR